MHTMQRASPRYGSERADSARARHAWSEPARWAPNWSVREKSGPTCHRRPAVGCTSPGPGIGTTITISVPASSEDRSRTVETEQTPAPDPIRALIVDDDHR